MITTIYRVDSDARAGVRGLADLLLEGSGKPVRIRVEKADGTSAEVDLPPEVSGMLQLGVRCLGDDGEVGVASGIDVRRR